MISGPAASTRTALLLVSAIVCAALIIGLWHPRLSSSLGYHSTTHKTPHNFTDHVGEVPEIVQKIEKNLTGNSLIDISNSTLGFGKIFVLSLPSRSDHRDALTIAASLTDIHFDWIDGVYGDDVSDKALPPNTDREYVGLGNLGSWRAHMNALQTVISQNLSSALICEDDIDWDIRLKAQLQDFAAGTRALLQPLQSGGYVDPTLESRASDPDVIPLDHDLDRDNTPPTIPPQISPYGDDWDVLWLGHCGANLARPKDKIPRARYVIPEDETVLSWEHRKGLDQRVQKLYPGHDRVIHHAFGPICTFAYAVSLQGARKILYHIGMKQFGLAFDNLLAIFCDDHRCMASQPAYFSHLRAAGPVDHDSDIATGNWGDEEKAKAHVREKATSENIRLSVRVNLKDLVNGKEAVDQYPD